MGRITVAVASILIFILLISACAGSDAAFSYKGDKENNVYHEPSCPEVANIRFYNIASFDTPEKAISSEYRPCTICNPATSTTELKSRDTDEDRLSDYDEIYVYDSNHLNHDSDRDLIGDYDEIYVYKTDPLDKDSDGDGSDDCFEILVDHTDPLSKDTDNDGLEDDEEVLVYKTNPTSSDSDGDGLVDGKEIRFYKTNPLNVDTDSDGTNDYDELFSDKDVEYSSKYDLPVNKQKSDNLDEALDNVTEALIIVTSVMFIIYKIKKSRPLPEQEKVVRQVYEDELQKQYAINSNKFHSSHIVRKTLPVVAALFFLGILLTNIDIILASLLLFSLTVFIGDSVRLNNRLVAAKCSENALITTAEKTKDKKIERIAKISKILNTERMKKVSIVVIIAIIILLLVWDRFYLIPLP